MPTDDKRDKPGGPAKSPQRDREAEAGSSDGDQDRPTVSPPFDPAEFAQQVLRDSPAAGTSATRREARTSPARGPMPTLTDASELEDARQRSIADDESKPRRPTPQSTISLANARAPSVIPPRKRRESGPRSGKITLRADDSVNEQVTKPPPPLRVDEGSEPPPFSETIDEPPSTKEAPAVGAKPAKAPDAVPTVQEMEDRVSLGDYTGALDIAERLLTDDPNHAAANAVADNCRGVLKKMYVARIGPMERVPIVMVPRDQLRWLSIDHRAGFVLSLIDGVSSLEMLLDVSGMPELDALRILSDLAQQRIISFR